MMLDLTLVSIVHKDSVQLVIKMTMKDAILNRSKLCFIVLIDPTNAGNVSQNFIGNMS